MIALGLLVLCLIVGLVFGFSYLLGLITGAVLGLGTAYWIGGKAPRKDSDNET